MKKNLVLSWVVVGGLVTTFLFGAVLLAPSAHAGDYYTPAGPTPTIKIGVDSEGATKVEETLGKEYSHTDWFTVYHGGPPFAGPLDPNIVNFEDHDAFSGADSLQVVSWDGRAGGTEGNSGSVDAFDYGSSGFDQGTGQVDALANHGDFLFRQVVKNEATLLFSVTADIDISTVLPPAGPGSSVGIVAKAHVHFEDPAPLDGMEALDTWALIETGSVGPGPGPGVNHHVVEDLDALEVWGPEPPRHENRDTPVVEGYIGGFPGPNTADADRFSMDLDSSTGVSVWAYDIPTAVVVPYIPHSDIVAAVEAMFLPDGFTFDRDARDQIDVDGTMVSDVGDASPTAPLFDAGDELLFTIDPILGATMLDPTGAPFAAPLIDGGEIMHLVKTAAGFSVSFLVHGGHVWDTAFDVSGTFGYFFEDVDALEAVGTLTGGTDIDTPEPAGFVLMMIGLVSAGWFRRR